MIVSNGIARGRRTLTLPSGLDILVASTLGKSLIDCRGEDVVVDASFFRWTGEHAVRVLSSALSVWKADGRAMTLANAPASLIEDLRYFGVEIDIE